MQGAAAAGTTTSVSGLASSWTRASSALASRHVGIVVASSSSSYLGPRRATATATAAVPPLPLLRVRCGCRLRPLSLLSDGGKNGDVTKPAAAAAAAAAAASVPADDASAAAVTREAGAAGSSGGIAATAQLGAMIVAWYLLNIYFNIYNKQVWVWRLAAVHCGVSSQDPLFLSSSSP